jgi:hypothetical protein
MIASTAGGPYQVPGQMLTFEFTLPVKADSSTGGTTDHTDTTSTAPSSTKPTSCDSMDEVVKSVVSNCQHSMNPN